VDNFALMESLIRLSLSAAHLAERVLGVEGVQAMTRTMRKLVGPNLPLWSSVMPNATKGGIPPTDRLAAQAVYYPSCISRVMGHLPGESSEMSLMQATVAVAQRAAVPVWIPEDAAGNCCGTPYSSKGFEEARDAMLNRIIGNFWIWSAEGTLPILVDSSPCAYGLLQAREFLTPENQQRFDRLTILDSIAFVHDQLLPRLRVNHPERSIALHPVCSAVKMGLTPKLEAIARKCSGEVFIPPSLGCCAFAGDRGFLYPELTASATAGEAAEIKAHKHDGCYSSSRTCEIGMTRSTEEVYRSYLYLLEKVTRD
jgi:D-lactate dehydrogenase